MKYSNIGGQAVMEGVMMRNGGRYAVAVRTSDNQIVVKQDEYQSLIKNKKILALPIVRGVFSFVDSLVLGMKTLMFSADFFAEETEAEMEERLEKEKKKAEKKASRLNAQGKQNEAAEVMKKMEETAAHDREVLKRKGTPEARPEDKEDNSLLMTLTVIFSIVMSVALFMMLPYFLSRALHYVTKSEALISIAEAILRMLIFIGYIWLISRMKEIQRTFMYHGAEHKCINCIEHGMELNVENVRKSSKEHKRCGTSFLLIVMVVSVIFFLFIRISSPVWRIVIRLLLVPVIAGVSFEFIRLAGRYDNKLVDVLSKPGLCLQGLTTKEPDDSMIEVGIASVEAVFNWKKYLNENFDAHYELDKEADEDQKN